MAGVKTISNLRKGRDGAQQRFPMEFLLHFALVFFYYACSEQEASKPPEGMVLIPAGAFQMGSTTGDVDEVPVHTVELDAFYMDQQEVTNAEYQVFVTATGYAAPRGIGYTAVYELLKQGYEPWDDPDFNHPTQPVTTVTWFDATAYCEWVDKRLPTEAEWEKAARGGLDKKQYPWGNGINLNRANYGKRLGETTPVDDYPPNDYGVYDIAGNVWEWCLDGYEVDFYANSPRRNPTAGANTVEEIVNNFKNIVDFRVLRGGGWNSEPEWLRAANRHGTSPAYAGIGALGFRCAKSVSP
jgi:formylglycine-generating enzyme required for sulfatase activity